MKSDRGRDVAAVACVVLGLVSIVLGLVLGYATRSVFDSRAFARHVSASLAEPGVANYVASRIADGVVAAKPDLIGLRPVIVAGGRTVVASPPFRAAAERAALETHRALMSGTGEKIMLSVKDVGEILQATLALHPEAAAKLPKRLSANLATLDQLPAGELTARLVRAGHRARAGFLALILGGLVLLAAGFAIGRDHQRGMFRIGVALAVTAAGLWLVARFGGLVVGALPRDPEIGMLVMGLWRAFVGGLGHWALGLGLVGLVIASASASLIERTLLEQRARDFGHWMLTPPAPRGLRFARGAALLALGVATVGWPIAMLGLAALVAGGILVFLGLRECFAATLRILPAMETRREAEGRDRGAGGWTPARVALAGTLAVALIALAAVWIARTPAVRPEPPAITACNGYPELCDRRVDQVVFPTAHNAMGGGDIPGWMFPNQNKGIPAQLEDGVRGFLIDAHYGMPVGDKVKTLLDDEKAAIAKYESAIGKEGLDAALRIRDRLVGGDERQRAVYMAHGFCELGATPLVDALTRMREFLVANPGEVLIIVIQDEGVAPQDIAKCFEQSGLIDFVYRGTARPPWPTLREMTESGQRVVVMAENDTTGVPWYHPAFAVMQETPYTFRDTTEFSERPNRGGTGGSLLLMNHWIESTPMPKPSNAAIVNRYDFLLARARRFERERGRVPNLVAVDFYATGDLMRVVKTLNRIGP